MGDVVPPPVLVSVGSLTCVPASVSVTDSFPFAVHCDWLLTGADFMKSLLLESGSGSIGLFLGSRAADVAGSGSGTVAAASSALLFLCSDLRSSSAIASLIISV